MKSTNDAMKKKRVSYRDAFRSLLKDSSSGGKRKRTHKKKRMHTWCLW